MEQLRLDKLLAATGRWSRRKAKELIREGRVTVDGRPPRSPEEKLDPAAARVTVDGEALQYEKYTYVMLHKPAGLLSATEDSRAATVLDLLPPELGKRGLFPVGRLDKDTEGLLLLTNHGELAHRLLSPRHHVDKVYFAQVQGELEQADVERFAGGIVLQDGLVCLPARLEILAPDQALVTVQEGKFHQVKRMLASCGKPVLRLKRLSMGPLTLDETLEAGQWRFLTEQEIRLLEEKTGQG